MTLEQIAKVDMKNCLWTFFEIIFYTFKFVFIFINTKNLQMFLCFNIFQTLSLYFSHFSSDSLSLSLISFSIACTLVEALYRIVSTRIRNKSLLSLGDVTNRISNYAFGGKKKKKWTKNLKIVPWDNKQ